MKSFMEIINQDELVIKTGVDKNGQPTKTELVQYPEMELADMFAQWLIDISSSRQNKYVVCKDWNKTSDKEFKDRGINDLKKDAQDFIFTLVYLTAATKDNAMVPSRDEDECTMAKDYNIPSGMNISQIIKYSHRVGLTTLLAEREKFALDTLIEFKVDKKRILSPSGMASFLKEHKNSGGDEIKTEAYTTMKELKLDDFEGFRTNVLGDKFEVTLQDNAKIAKEISQILKITGTKFEGLGREQETLNKEVLVRWLAKAKSE